MSTRSRRGASIWATKSSQYSLTPSNSQETREGRTTRASGGGRRLVRLGGERNLRLSTWSAVNLAKQATIALGETYAESGIPQRERFTRSLAVKGSFRNTRVGMFFNQRNCRRGADPPKND